MRITVNEREALRKRVQNAISQMKKSEIVKHFVAEGIARSTIYDTIKRVESSLPLKDRKKTGRPSSWTGARRTKLKRLVNNRTGVSQRRLGRKFSVHHTTIGRELAKVGICYRKREKTPKYNTQQQEKAKVLCAKLANKLYRSNCSLILDDEKYFTFAGNNMPGNSGYYAKNKSACPDSVRFAGKEKFPKKVLVWVAISDRGLSKPLFRPTNSVAIKTEIYIEECLEKRLLPFIHEHHADFNYIFWPDLASAHYSKLSVDWMEEYVRQMFLKPVQLKTFGAVCFRKSTREVGKQHRNSS
jgi:transposase